MLSDKYRFPLQPTASGNMVSWGILINLFSVQLIHFSMYNFRVGNDVSTFQHKRPLKSREKQRIGFFQETTLKNAAAELIRFGIRKVRYLGTIYLYC